jgi:hypothetical protein
VLGSFRTLEIQDHSPCPRCDAEHEDPCHVYQYLAHSTKLGWHRAMNDLHHWCDLQERSSAIMEAILKFLKKAWQAGQSLPHITAVMLWPTLVKHKGLLYGAASWEGI